MDKELLFNIFRAKKNMPFFETITSYLKTFSKSIKEDENMSLKNKTLIGGWTLIASKVYRRENLSCRFEDWLYNECKIKGRPVIITQIFTS